MKTGWRRSGWIALMVLGSLVVGAGQGWAQGTDKPGMTAARPAASSADRAAATATPRAARGAPSSSREPGNKRAAATVPAAPVRSGKGWAVGPVPAWVVAPAQASTTATRAPDLAGRREVLLDLQANHSLSKPQYFVRSRAMALDAATLGQVSQPQISFNPAFQQVVLHEAAVWRNGERLDRLADARIEPIRRERRLEQSVIDGNETLLLVLPDVRVGEPVEVVYTIEGENPIFEGRIWGHMLLAYSSPIDLLHHRVIVPAGKALTVAGRATTIEPERFTEGANQVLRIVRHQVPGISLEPGIPPWTQAFPGVEYTEFTHWREVDEWAQRLFATAMPVAEPIMAKARELEAKGLSREALLSEAIRFVQDEVRYFSISLGESSHRPKPPAQTLAERLGDCKDKAQLLNALLRELGFDARPALVSIQRNRAAMDQLPSPGVFDHVITRVEFDGKAWFIDGTATGQGTGLSTRGRYPYGVALVVGAGQGPQPLPESAAPNSRVDYLHDWDLRRPGQPGLLVTTMRAHGFSAERWRAMLAELGSEQAAQAATSGLARVYLGLTPSAAPQVTDDRAQNVLEIRQTFSLPEWGRYDRASLEMETAALELYDALSSPNETQRRFPYLLDFPQVLESRISLTGPVPLQGGVPESREVADRHFRYSVRLEQKNSTATFVRRLERRADEVRPADMASWREKLNQSRQTLTGQVRLPLLSRDALNGLIARLERSYKPKTSRDDNLQRMLVRNEVTRAVDAEVLEQLPAGAALSARVLASRAQSHNLLGAFADGLADADKALNIRAQEADAMEARAVALLGLGRATEALDAFKRLHAQTRTASAAVWIGSLELISGEAAKALPWLREAVSNGSGTDREFALIWLYLAAERSGGQGKVALGDQIESVDPAKFTGVLLHYLTGRIDQAELLRRAAEARDMERLNLAEARFFIGQRLLLEGQKQEAQAWFRRTLETEASPYRELSFARLELQQAPR